MTGPLRVPAFRRMWAAGLISDTGDWLLLISLPLVVFDLTGSALGTATALLFELAPAILVAPLAGRLADRMDRRRLLLVVSVLQGLALLPLTTVHGRADLPIVYLVIVVESALLTVFDPAKNALLPTLVDEADLVPANALVGLGQNLGRLAGGPLGGVLLAIGGLGPVVAVDAASYLVAAVLIARLRVAAESGVLPAPIAAAPEPAAAAPLALRAALRPRPVRAALLATFVTQLAQGIFLVLFILFVAHRLGGSAAETGLLRGVQAIGAIAGGLAVLGPARRLPPGRLAVRALIAIGLLELTLWNLPALTTALPLYVAIFVFVGAPGIAVDTGIMSALQLGVPDAARGRVLSAYGLAGYTGQALGMLAAGLLTPVVGLVALLNVQASLFLLAAVMALPLATSSRVGRLVRSRTDSQIVRCR